MALNDYMYKTFPHLALRPPLFYNWDIGIRFELGVDYDPGEVCENGPYLQGVYERATQLFKSLHAPNDSIYIVVDVSNSADSAAFKHKLNTFSKYVKEKSLLYKLGHDIIPYIFWEDDEDGSCRTHRFTLPCKTSQLRYIPILKAICNHDLGIRPSIFHRVYFINRDKHTIFHVYDDRGCDVVATSPETIKGIYKRYNDWILDYDRNEIDQVFK
ncbi:DUF3885 domain-containing protein [Pseudobacillus wudalianchiensis]|uniref:DUF3885 domain-containing protein n=1 Tax=Pseudobacillus wudalianchiensis TaxID=1743143 RepID=A0A1B9B9W0_9BACI|nr:DUF3885 domain-containing protein [Bacillus wudalianchiensis]OCA92862.1 hypothetical protein A8F95_04035 [Bacillus wudalianchiensis]